MHLSMHNLAKMGCRIWADIESPRNNSILARLLTTTANALLASNAVVLSDNTGDLPDAANFDVSAIDQTTSTISDVLTNQESTLAGAQEWARQVKNKGLKVVEDLGDLTRDSWNGIVDSFKTYVGVEGGLLKFNSR